MLAHLPAAMSTHPPKTKEGVTSGHEDLETKEAMEVII
jgi:hypothetical protein